MKDHAKIVTRLLMAPDDWDCDIMLREFDSATIVAAIVDALLSVRHPSSTTLELTGAARRYEPGDETVRRVAELIASGELSDETAAACVRALEAAPNLRARLGLTAERFDALVATHVAWDRADEHGTRDWWARQVPPLPPLGPDDTQPVAFVRRQWVLAELELQRHMKERSGLYDEIIEYYRQLPDGSDAERALASRYPPRDFSEALVHFLFDAHPGEWEHAAWHIVNGSASSVVTTRLLALVEDDARPVRLRQIAFRTLGLIIAEPFAKLRDEGLFDNVDPDALSAMEDAYHIDFAMAAPDGRFLAFGLRLCDADRFDRVIDAVLAAGLPVDWPPFLDDTDAMHLWPRVAEELANNRDTSRIDRLAECAELVTDPDARTRLRRALMRLRSLT